MNWTDHRGPLRIHHSVAHQGECDLAIPPEGKLFLIVDRSPSRMKQVALDCFPVTGGTILDESAPCYANSVLPDADELYCRRIFGNALVSLPGISDRVNGSGSGTAEARLG